jgi:putative salt-induced outer membrane protein
VHDYYVLALRAEQDDNATASRYELGGKSGYKLNERSYVYGSLRYENDDFAPFEYQGTGSIGYGFWALKDEATTWLFEIGPGARHAEPVGPQRAETDFIARGFMDFKHKLTATTEVFDTLLIEAASDNTFVQNDVGISVSINASLALKAALQARHNTDAQPGADKTDTLTTINVVWSPK